MNWLQKLKKRQSEVHQEITRICTEANKRDNPGFTDSERDNVKSLRAELSNLGGDIEIAEEEEKRSTPPPPRNAFDPGQDPDNKEDRGGLLTKDEKNECPMFFRSLPDQLHAVKRHAQGLGDDRLSKLRNWEREQRSALGSSEQIDSDSGYLIQPQFMDQLLARAMQSANFAANCTQIPMTSNLIRIPGFVDDNLQDGSRFGGVRAYWVNEAGTASPTKPKFRYIELGLQKLMATAYATDEELEDLPAFNGILNTALTSEIGWTLDNAIFNGSGAGLPKGFIKSGAKITVAKESAQAAATVLFKNIVKMRKALDAGCRKNAVFYYNQDMEDQLILMVFDPSSTVPIPVWLPANSAANQPYDRLLNIPMIPVPQCETTGTEGDIVLADLSQYLLVTRGGLQSAVSMHVAFLSDEQAFRFTLRCNGQLAWDKPRTPQKGSNQTSCIVTLATRS